MQLISKEIRLQKSFSGKHILQDYLQTERNDKTLKGIIMTEYRRKTRKFLQHFMLFVLENFFKYSVYKITRKTFTALLKSNFEVQGTFAGAFFVVF